jgi:hypothetical protein
MISSTKPSSRFSRFASTVATSPSKPQSGNKILSVEKFLDFIEKFMTGYEHVNNSGLKFASFNPEVINCLFSRIATSRNKTFRENLEKSPLTSQTVQRLPVEFQ